jgi:hypothetical protein
MQKNNAVRPSISDLVSRSAYSAGIQVTPLFVETITEVLVGLVVSDPVLFAKFIDNSFVSGELFLSHTNSTQIMPFYISIPRAVHREIEI